MPCKYFHKNVNIGDMFAFLYKLTILQEK